MLKISDYINKSRDNEKFLKDEVIKMLSLDPQSNESYQIMAESNRISIDLSDNKAEIHAQFAVDLSPCNCNCKFCSFAASNKIFDKNFEITFQEAISKAMQFESDGANAIYLMSTTNYDFKKFIDISIEVKRNLRKETILIANVGDKSYQEAMQLKDAGYFGAYHALRLREGIDNRLMSDARKQSIKNFIEAGLAIGTCVEPIGPEHSSEEIAELILFTASFNPAFSGAMRRINLPGGELSKFGMISELRMAQIVAVTRLIMPRSVTGNCTHEPCTLGAAAGANLFWAEAGANPRDVKENTEEGRGNTVEHCKKLFSETGWETLTGASKFFS